MIVKSIEAQDDKSLENVHCFPYISIHLHQKLVAFYVQCMRFI